MNGIATQSLGEQEGALKTRLYGFIVLLAMVMGFSVSAPCFAATVQEVIKKVSALPPARYLGSCAIRSKAGSAWMTR